MGNDAEALGWKPAEVLREAERFQQYWVVSRGGGKAAHCQGAGVSRGATGYRRQRGTSMSKYRDAGAIIVFGRRWFRWRSDVSNQRLPHRWAVGFGEGRLCSAHSRSCQPLGRRSRKSNSTQKQIARGSARSAARAAASAAECREPTSAPR